MNNKKKWLSIAVISFSISALIYGIVNFYNENEKVDLMNDFILKNNNNFKSDNLKFSSKLKK